MATKKISSVYTELKVRLDKYEADLAKAKKITNRSAGKIQSSLNRISFSSATNSMAKFGRSFLRMRSLFAVGLAGFGIGKIAGSFVEVAESFEQMQAKLDILTAGKGAEKLKEINDWALSLPISTKEVTQAFVRMTAMGLNPTMDRMKALANVAAVMGDDVLPRLSLQLGQAAAKGKIMQQDINIMGEAGINVAKYLRDAFGMTVTELASSGIDIQKQLQVVFDGMARDFDGSIDKMSKTWRGLKAITNSYFVEIQRRFMQGGVFSALKEKLNEVNTATKDWMDSNKQLLEQDMPEYFSRMIDKLADMGKVTIKTVGTLARLKGFFDKLMGTQDFGERKDAPAHLDRIKSYLRERAGTSWQFPSLGMTGPGQVGGAMTYKPPPSVAVEVIKKIGKSTADTTKETAKLNEQYISTLSTLREISDSWDAKRNRTFTDEQKEKAEQLRNAFDSLQSKKINDDLEKAFEGVDESATKAFDSMIQLSERTAWAMQENFSNVFYDAMKGELKSFKDYFSSIIDSMQRAWADIMGQMASEWIFGSGMKGGGALSTAWDFLSGYLGGGGSAGGATALSSARWSPRATGGPVSTAKKYLVGESGPELFIPNSDGRIDNLRGSSASNKSTKNIYNVYHITANDAASFLDMARRSGAIPLLAAENLSENGLLRSAILENV